MIVSEHCGNTLYDTQYHSLKTSSNRNAFIQGSDLVLEDSTAATALEDGVIQTSPSSPQVSYGMTPSDYNPPQSQHNPIQQTIASHKYPPNININYPLDNDFFYASLPPPPASLISVSPTNLARHKPFIKRNIHPRHHSANGILQKYSHQQQQQGNQQHLLTAQRRLSSSTIPYINPHSTDPAISLASSNSLWTTNMHHHSTLSSPSLSSSSSTGTAFSSQSSTMISTLKRSQYESPLGPVLSLSTPLRYQVLLQASTASALKYGESSSLTYLNRGQAYGLHFQDLQQHQSLPNTIITSTISITFHDATHRLASQNYWRFWLSQQDHPNEARALDLDIQQSSGLVNIYYPSFDSITIQWQSHVGATLFVRFNCLSTDFSRIKGVKGIPLRALVTSTPSSEGGGNVPCTEKSFCKIKLFRDKGAERKSKDDAKQISKQLDKMKADGNPQHNPLWHFYSQPVLPHSVFEALPEEDYVLKEDLPLMSSPSLSSTSSSSSSPTSSSLSAALPSSTVMTATPIPTLPTPTVASTIATSPIAYGLSAGYSSSSSSSVPSTNALTSHLFTDANRNIYQQQQHNSGMIIMSSFDPPTISYPSQFVQPTSLSTPTSLMCSPVISSSIPLSSLGYEQHQRESPSLGMKRSRSHITPPSLDHSPPYKEQQPMKKHHGSPSVALTLFVDTKKHPSSSSSERIDLEVLSVQHLITKLCGLFSLQAQSVTEVLWRRDPTGNSTQESNQPKKSASSVLVLVEDCVLEHFPDRTHMNVQWEISSNGMVRFILDF